MKIPLSWCDEYLDELENIEQKQMTKNKNNRDGKNKIKKSKKTGKDKIKNK